MRPATALALCLGISAVVVRPQARTSASALALRVAIDSEHRATIVLSGAPRWCCEDDGTPCHAEARGPRGKSRIGMSNGETVLAFYVGDAKSTDIATTVDGTYEFSDTSVIFRPYYPLVPGVEYSAVAHVGDLQSAGGGPAPDARATLTEHVFIPADPIVSRTVVTAVYPTADTLPENLLKFYIHFSRPMREGDAARHVALLDERGRAASHALLATDTELWDRSHQRLTILLDPGRIKRGLRPNQELGTPLAAGRRYRLRIDSTWRDADGAPLIGSHEKSFIGAPAIRTPLSTREWRVTAPRAGTVDPIELHLPRPIDHALAQRLVAVDGPAGAAVVVTSRTVDAERTIHLVPRLPWAPGDYRVRVGAEIEDVAGNNLQRLFDVDLADPATRPRDNVSVESIRVRIAPSSHPR